MPKNYRTTGREWEGPDHREGQYVHFKQVEPTYRDQDENETFGAWVTDVIPEYWKELREAEDNPLEEFTERKSRDVEPWDVDSDTTDIASLVRGNFKTKAIPGEPIKGLGRRQIETYYPETTTEMGRRLLGSNNDDAVVKRFLNEFARGRDNEQ